MEKKKITEMEICECGHIHFYDADEKYSVIEEDKEFVLICSSCGCATHIGADKSSYGNTMYAYRKKNEVITADNFDKEKMDKLDKRTIGKIIMNEGKSVMMETGFLADYFNTAVGFMDCNSHFRPEGHETTKELMAKMRAYDEKRCIVCKGSYNQTFTAEEKEVLSHYSIPGF